MTGTVVGCLRRLQQWNLTPILEEVSFHNVFGNIDIRPSDGSGVVDCIVDCILSSAEKVSSCEEGEVSAE